ncbi:AraC family transcriptional regulator [Larkinella harenae]
MLRFGYHDHSHLIKDFKYYLGLTPRQFLRQLTAGSICLSKTGKFY